MALRAGATVCEGSRIRSGTQQPKKAGGTPPNRADMKLFVGVTDNEWYRFLAGLKPDEVNFWRPSGRSFRAVPIGAPFLFKLHSPLNAIAGGGFFVRSDQLPLVLAWDVFGPKNGAGSLPDLRRTIQARRGDAALNPQIGCIILNAPFFFPQEEWISLPSDWSRSIETGKTYDTADAVGRRLWAEVRARLTASGVPAPPLGPFTQLGEASSGYSAPYLARARLGQGAFRLLVEDAYQRRCAITGEKVRSVLHASHIKPFADQGPSRVDNGVLLRSDLHNLFDDGYITLTRDLRVEVSGRIRQESQNGEHYYSLQGKRLLVVPESACELPNPEFIAWHNQHVFER